MPSTLNSSTQNEAITVPYITALRMLAVETSPVFAR